MRSGRSSRLGLPAHAIRGLAAIAGDPPYSQPKAHLSSACHLTPAPRLTPPRRIPQHHPPIAAMTQPVPTVDDLLRWTCTATMWGTGETLHHWRNEGGAIEVPGTNLRPALEAAYDPLMPNWPAMVEIEA